MNNGGPAFPGFGIKDDGETVVMANMREGMALLDWFAVQVLAQWDYFPSYIQRKSDSNEEIAKGVL